MTACVVATTIKGVDDQPIPGAIVYFSLVKGSYTIDAQYPKGTIKAIANQAGEVRVELWIDGTGLIPTRWAVGLPSGESMKFRIPAGTTEATLEELLMASTPAPPLGSSEEVLLGTLITAHNADPSAHPGLGGAAQPSLPAGENLSALRVIARSGDNYVYADPLSPALVWAISGITNSAAAIGGQIAPIRDGPITDPSWDWDLGQPIFLGAGGALTQIPPTAGHLIQVAQPMSATTIFVSIEEPIAL